MIEGTQDSRGQVVWRQLCVWLQLGGWYIRGPFGDDRSFSGTMSLGLDIDQKIEVVEALIKKAMAKSGSERPVYISFDEWSGGRSSRYGCTPYNVQGARMLGINRSLTSSSSLRSFTGSHANDFPSRIAMLFR